MPPAKPEPLPVAKGPLALGFTMPTPRAAAAAVLAMLGFGVLIGSFGSPTLQSLASAPLLLAVSPPSSSPTAASTPTGSAAAAASGGSSGGAATKTITVTTQAPATPQPAGDAAASPGLEGGGVAVAGGSGTTGGGGSSSGLDGLPPVHHVFLIVLSEQGFGQTFAPSSADHYLADTLARQGEVINNYYAVAGSDLANRIALISGQGPTPQTLANCPKFDAIRPGAKHAMGQIIGGGCVYPGSALTLADQLTAKHKTWKAYVEGVDKGPRGQVATCRHPKLGQSDADQTARAHDPYVTWSNPFVYFKSLSKGADSACRQYDVGLDRLTSDLKSASTTPTFAYIAPGPCEDGSDQPCVPKAKAGLATADEFLRSVVPRIKTSPAYKDNGLIAITFDEAQQTGPHADQSACCNTPKYPNLPATTTTTPSTPGATTTSPTTGATTTNPAVPPAATVTTPATTTTTTTPATTTTTMPPATTTTTTPPATGTGLTSPTGGGGQVGLLLISRYVKPGSNDLVDYFNHYSLLATIENLFGLMRIGYAGNFQLPVFDASIFNGQQQ
jgi:phosphatidylinositol-3-phosphatase